ncbi:hypothetical protein H0H92_004002 [Tricholoma furcatifolium]|nr:hypothetical protein H0H92_004002 [Tricholoma furcatifolium]
MGTSVDKTLLDRENWKEATQGSQQCKYPSLGEHGNKELLVGKEKPTEKAETVRPDHGAPLRVVEVAICPSERASLINKSIVNALAQQKERDHHWEDSQIHTDGQPILEGRRQPRAIRRSVMVDRQDSRPRHILSTGRSSLFASNNDDVVMADTEDEDRTNRAAARWRFDDDDSPATGPESSDEQNRILFDDYSPRLLSHMMTFMGEIDQQNLVTDPSIPIIHEGHQWMVLPYRLGMKAAASPPATTRTHT